jgi:hypothetical protein
MALLKHQDGIPGGWYVFHSGTLQTVHLRTYFTECTGQLCYRYCDLRLSDGTNLDSWIFIIF